MSNKTIFLLLFFLLLAIATCFAEVNLKAQVDRKNLSSDEILKYQLIIGSSENKLPQLTLPSFKGFNIISQANSTSFSFGQGNIKTSFAYTFILVPNTVGKLKIESAKIKEGSQTYSSDAFEIEVKQGKNKIIAPNPKQNIPATPGEPPYKSEKTIL